MIDLGSPDDYSSVADSINDSGQIAGTYSPSAGGGSRAFIYTGVPGSGGMRIDLGTLGGYSSVGRAINANGQVTGASITESGGYAFLYTGIPGMGGKMFDLGTLGGHESSGVDINAAGQIVGYAYTKGELLHAFLYTGTPGADGKMFDLGTLGGAGSGAVAINASGQIVGGSDVRSRDETHAFIYTGTPGVDGQMIDLDAWLNANNPAEGAQWTLRSAYGLTDQGLVTGWGIYYGPDGVSQGYQAFLLDASSLLVPEPASFVLLGLGVLLWLRCASK